MTRKASDWETGAHKPDLLREEPLGQALVETNPKGNTPLPRPDAVPAEEPEPEE